MHQSTKYTYEIVIVYEQFAIPNKEIHTYAYEILMNRIKKSLLLSS